MKKCAITGFPIEPKVEFWVIGADDERSFLVSTHSTKAEARAKIRWELRPKNPRTPYLIKRIEC